MYLNLYSKLQPHIPRKAARLMDMPIYSFSGEVVYPITIVEVPVRIRSITTNVELFVANIDFPDNAILAKIGWER